MITLALNQELNGIELTFDSKPSEETRAALKAEGFRWHKQRGLWYAKNTPERLALAESLADGTAPTMEADTKAEKAPEVLSRDEIRAAYGAYWDDKMADYCTKKTAEAVRLPGGEVITIDKQSIEKNFCFGESGHDIDDALAAAEHARTSEKYFLDENMEHFRRWVSDLEDAAALNFDKPMAYAVIIYPKAYHGQDDACPIASISFRRFSDVIEDQGGSAYVPELPGKTATEYNTGRAYRIPTAEDFKIIIAAYKRASAAHEKRVKKYLKRYGLEHVHSWTYWRDR